MGAVRIEVEADLYDQRLLATAAFNFQFEPGLAYAVDILDEFPDHRLPLVAHTFLRLCKCGECGTRQLRLGSCALPCYRIFESHAFEIMLGTIVRPRLRQRISSSDLRPQLIDCTRRANHFVLSEATSP